LQVAKGVKQPLRRPKASQEIFVPSFVLFLKYRVLEVLLLLFFLLFFFPPLSTPLSVNALSVWKLSLSLFLSLCVCVCVCVCVCECVCVCVWMPLYDSRYNCASAWLWSQLCKTVLFFHLAWAASAFSSMYLSHKLAPELLGMLNKVKYTIISTF